MRELTWCCSWCYWCWCWWFWCCLCLGTTTATILARAMYSEGCKAVAAGMNPMDLRKGVQMAVDQVIEDLATMSQPTEVRASITNASTRANEEG